VYEVPLLSADAAVHDRMSAAPGAFDRVTMAIACLKAARQRVVGVFVATRLNLPGWRQIAELAVALGLDGLAWCPSARGAARRRPKHAWGTFICPTRSSRRSGIDRSRPPL